MKGRVVNVLNESLKNSNVLFVKITILDNTV